MLAIYNVRHTAPKSKVSCNGAAYRDRHKRLAALYKVGILPIFWYHVVRDLPGLFESAG